MRKLNKRLILCFIVVLLSVTVSFSWILDSVYEPPTTTLKLDMRGHKTTNQLKIVDVDGYSMEIYYYTSDNEPEPVGSNSMLSLSGMVPGDSLRFTIRIKNTTGDTTSMKLFLTDLGTAVYTGVGNYTSPDDIYDYIYLSVTGGKGYADTTNVNVTQPDWIYKPLSQLRSTASDNTAVLYTDLCVPYTPGTEYVELECRFWLDINATDLEGISLQLGKFVLSL